MEIVNGMGAVFIVSLGWFFIMVSEMLLLFIPIYAFLKLLRSMTRGYNKHHEY